MTDEPPSKEGKVARKLGLNPSMLDIIQRDQAINPARWPKPNWKKYHVLDTCDEACRPHHRHD